MLVSSLVIAPAAYDEQVHEPLLPFVIIKTNIRCALDAMARIMGLRKSAEEAFSVFVRSWSDLKAFERS